MTTSEKPGCLASFLARLGFRRGTPQAMPYHVRDDFLSPAEFSFYRVLRVATSDWAVVCPKVALGDLFFAKTGGHRQNRSWMNRIDRKHVDFLLCDPKTMRPMLGIELDDASHRRSDREQRDLLVEQAFAAAKLPLARVPVRAEYSVPELRVWLLGQVASPAAAAPTPPTPQAAAPAQPAAAPGGSVPLCPKCGSPMVLRVVSQEGPQKGKHFWGCPNYPKCRGVRRVVQEE
jgi:hypothetical protein